MVWPDVEQIKEAFVVDANVIDGTIRGKYKCVLGGRRNKPLCCPGGFCVAFKMTNSSGGNLCYRLWHVKPNDDLQKRLQLISNALRSYKLPYFVDFNYTPKALKIGSTYVPGVSMEWVDGKTLSDFIQEGHPASVYKELADKFMRMCQDFRRVGISHGDLSCANILITPNNNIRLVDYDSVFVPSMGNSFYQITGGIESFQHPERMKSFSRLKANANDDNFSQQVIYLSLLALAKDTTLSSIVGEKDLLFEDFSSEYSFVSSRGYKAVAAILDVEIQKRLEELKKAVRGSLSAVRSIVDFAMPVATPHYVEYCVRCGHKFPNQTDKYCTQCGAERLKYAQ